MHIVNIERPKAVDLDIAGELGKFSIDSGFLRTPVEAVLLIFYEAAHGCERNAIVRASVL